MILISARLLFGRSKFDFSAVLRIHDILVSIRMRIRILLFSSLTFNIPTKKTNLKKKIFCFLLISESFTSFFNDKKSKEVIKQ
jgi:hypothetical protein